MVTLSRGRKHLWHNVVIACTAYNSRKDNKTPQEVGMTPIYPTVAFAEQFWQQPNQNINQ
ncbi:MAG TPA: hypothetical protein ACFCUY_05555 [Xenococcaceae cyanobacterium]